MMHTRKSAVTAAWLNRSRAKLELFRERIRRVKTEWRLPSRGRMSDVGTGRGSMLDAMHMELPDWELVATETSPSASLRVLEKGYQVVDSAERLDQDQSFDWINIDNVLEHLPRPQRALAHLRKRLAPGGFIYVDVPNESLFSLRYRLNDAIRGHAKLPTAAGHINLFTRSTLKKVAQRAGLDCGRIWLESVAQPNRLFGALGAKENPRISTVLNVLRATKVDVQLGLAYFICARLEA